MALRKLVRRSYDGKLPVSIKYQNLHTFKEGLILLCQSILETRRITHLHGSAHFTTPLNTTNISYNPIENAICKYENHPSVVAIKNIWKVLIPHFPFRLTKENTAELIKNSDNLKAVQSTDIPNKLAEEFSCFYSSFIATNINKYINEGY